MENELLTIKQVAELVNTSYQNIYQRLNSSLKDYLVIVNGRKMVKPSILSEFNISTNEEDIKDEIKSENKSILNDNSIPLHQSNEEELNELIKELRAEIKKKDEIIISKDEQLQKQTEQIIDLSNRVVELFENSQKLQIQTSYLLSENNSDRNDLHTLRPSDEIIEERPPKKKGFLSRFFK